MAKLEIDGRIVEVDDSFLKLSPADQERTVNEIAATFAPPPAAPARKGFLANVDAAVRGAADTLTFGLADEFAAGADALLNPLVGTGESGGSFGDRYSRNVERQRAIDKADANERPLARFAGQAAGGLAGGVGLARSGLSLGANAAQAGQGLGRVAAGSAADGVVLGGLHGAGSGEDLSGRLTAAGVGVVAGGGIGAAAPYAVAGASKIALPFIAPIMSRLRPETYADAALGQSLRRSGQTVDQVTQALLDAQRGGQPMFNVADAMGHAGGRMMSTVARNPNDARETVVKALIARQMDQGGRVANALQEASGTKLTAEQLRQGLSVQRAAEASANYAPVRVDQTAIDVSPSVALANRSISPAADNLANARNAVPTDLAARSGIEAGEAAIRDPIRQALKEARSYLASDGATVTNVQKAFRAKTNIDQMIAKAAENKQGAMVEALKPMRDALDDALARTSTQYAAARDAYNARSGVIDAIETGRDLAKPRTRPQDNIDAFRAMTPDQQAAARAGYFDPLISRAEGTVGTGANAARPLISPRNAAEFHEFAAPGQAQQLTDRIAREQRMFETGNAALGGSKTADNLADAMDLAKFDPGIMSALTRGNVKDAMIAAATRAINEARGESSPVIERIARVLMTTAPEEARRLLSKATDRTAVSDGQRAVANAILNMMGASGSGRLAAP